MMYKTNAQKEIKTLAEEVINIASEQEDQSMEIYTKQLRAYIYIIMNYYILYYM